MKELTTEFYSNLLRKDFSPNFAAEVLNSYGKSSEKRLSYRKLSLLAIHEVFFDTLQIEIQDFYGKRFRSQIHGLLSKLYVTFCFDVFVLLVKYGQMLKRSSIHKRKWHSQRLPGAV